METFELQATVRNAEGTRKARGIRRREFIPCIVYGHGMKPLTLEVPEREFGKALHTKAGENVLISLKVQGVELKESTCRIKEIQPNPVTDKIDHVDFMVISMTEQIKVMVLWSCLTLRKRLGSKKVASLMLFTTRSKSNVSRQRSRRRSKSM
jgi:large subunit ribosomal protein L25